MAWWHFGKKKRQNKQSSSAPQKDVLDEKRANVSSPKDAASKPISPRPPDEPIGAAPYELQREGTPPILTEEPVRSLPNSPKSPKSHNRNISDASSSQGRSEPIPQTPPQYPSQIQPQGLSQVAEQDIEHEPLLEPSNGEVPETAPQSEYPEAPIEIPEETRVYLKKRSLMTPAEFLLEAPQGFTRETSKSPPKSPVRPTRRSSIEDITALPAAPKTLERSPHLRPVPESDANVRAGTSASNRATSKKKSTRRRKEDAVREKELRTMTDPLPPPKRVVTKSSEVFRRDSKRMRDDLNKPIDPTSTTSVQRPTSARSSITGMSDAHRLAVGFVDILAPRPRMRYSMQGPYEAGSLRSPSRADSKREFPAIPRSSFEENKKIDELADEMDTGSLRELMDRDQRRREKKRKAEQDRARRRLERLAARGEKDAEAKLNQMPPPVPPLPSRVDTDTAGPSGVAREYPRDIHPALRDPSPIPEDVDATDTTTDPFKDPEEEMEPVSAIQETETLEKSPFDDPPHELVEDVQQTQENAPADDDSIQVSPVEDTRLDTQQTQESEAVADSIQASPVDDTPKEFLPDTTEPRSVSLQDDNEKPEVDRRISQSSARRSGGIVGLFRRSLIGKRDSTASGSEEPSKRPYSMSSRESMSRRGPVENNHERTYRRSSTGVPVRTASKFKENLPDAPAIPGNSEAEPYAFMTMPSAEEFAAAESAKIEELPADEAEPESLASVDAEGAWLSGRQGKRASQQASLGRSSLVQQPALSTSMEEIKTPATEAYFTPTEESPAQFPPISSPEFEQQQGQSAAPPVEEAEGQVIRRTPKVVQVEPRVQSTVGLLQVADDDDLDSSSGDDHVEVYQVEEAIAADSVTRQASHARQISAGSARLFEVPSKRDSQPPLPTSET